MPFDHPRRPADAPSAVAGLARSSALAVAVLLLAACSDGGSPIGDAIAEVDRIEGGVPGDDRPGDECSVQAQNEWVYASMRDYYLFADQVPTLDPAAFDDPRAVLAAARYEPLDRFSFLTDTAGNSLAFEQGREFGLGHNVRRDDDGAVRVVSVEPLSPVGVAGIERGDTVLAIDGRDALEAFGDRETFLGEVIGTPDAPGRSVWTVLPRDGGAVREVNLVATEYAIRTVVTTDVLTNPALDGAVGYLNFSSFLRTSEAELDAVFTDFAERGVTELVLDLRYNGGGFISVAGSLASRIAGNALVGQPLYRYQYNERYASENYDLPFLEANVSLDLSRVIVLTTVDTASASEIVINGLAPYIDVVTVGGRTNGKPYVQSPNDRCGQRLFAVEAEGLNVAGVNVFGGIEPTCQVADDLDSDFGLSVSEESGEDRIEGMLASALDYIETGNCAAQLAGN